MQALWDSILQDTAYQKELVKLGMNLIGLLGIAWLSAYWFARGMENYRLKLRTKEKHEEDEYEAHKAIQGILFKHMQMFARTHSILCSPLDSVRDSFGGRRIKVVPNEEELNDWTVEYHDASKQIEAWIWLASNEAYEAWHNYVRLVTRGMLYAIGGAGRVFLADQEEFADALNRVVKTIGARFDSSAATKKHISPRLFLSVHSEPSSKSHSPSTDDPHVS